MKIGLIKGRHSLPVENYIFDKDIEDPTNLDKMYKVVEEKLKNVDPKETLEVYVTGLTVALTTVIKYCFNNDINLTLYHYDTKSGEYFPQIIFNNGYCSYCKTNSRHNWYCTNCGAS